MDLEIKKEEEVIKNLRSYFEDTTNGDFIKIYSDSNKGCKEGVRHAISKSFELFDELIIVEDDILPSKKFLNFRKKCYICTKMKTSKFNFRI